MLTTAEVDFRGLTGAVGRGRGGGVILPLMPILRLVVPSTLVVAPAYASVSGIGGGTMALLSEE